MQKEGVKLNFGTPEKVHYVKLGMSNKEQCLETLEQVLNVQEADVKQGAFNKHELLTLAKRRSMDSQRRVWRASKHNERNDVSKS